MINNQKKAKKGKGRHGEGNTEQKLEAAAPVPVLAVPDGNEFLRKRAVDVDLKTKKEISFRHPAIAVEDVSPRPAADTSLSGTAA
jgi:hypothetical protein